MASRRPVPREASGQLHVEVATSLLGVFAGVALLLAAIGIYGCLAAPWRSAHKIGIRLALGAQSRDVPRLVLVQGIRSTGVGAVVGAIAEVGLTRLMVGLLYGLTATEPLTFVGMVGILIVVALLARWFRAGGRVDPMVAMRHE